MKLGVFALAVLLFVPGLVAQSGEAVQADPKKELEKLKGDWLITSFNGQEVPADAEAYLVFNGDKYEQWTMDQVDERGTIKIDTTSKPMKIDLVITEGADAGKTQLGLYDVTEDTLTVGLAMPGETTRPTALNRAALYVVLKKAQ